MAPRACSNLLVNMISHYSNGLLWTFSLC